MCEEIHRQESLHTYHFCIVRRSSMLGKFTLLWLNLYCTNASNVMKVYIAITLYRAKECQESLHRYRFVLRKASDVRKVYIDITLYTKTYNVMKFYIAITFVLATDIQCQKSLHYYHFCIGRRQPMSRKSKLLSLYNIVRGHKMTGKSASLSFCIVQRIWCH